MYNRPHSLYQIAKKNDFQKNSKQNQPNKYALIEKYIAKNFKNPKPSKNRKANSSTITSRKKIALACFLGTLVIIAGNTPEVRYKNKISHKTNNNSNNDAWNPLEFLSNFINGLSSLEIDKNMDNNTQSEIQHVDSYNNSNISTSNTSSSTQTGNTQPATLEQQIENNCTQKPGFFNNISLGNKRNNITLGANYDGKSMPISCIHDMNSDSCKEDTKYNNEFYQSEEYESLQIKLIVMREDSDIQYNNWKKNFQAQFYPMLSSLTERQIQILDREIKKIYFLKEMLYGFKNTLKHGIGQCGEINGWIPLAMNQIDGVTVHFVYLTTTKDINRITDHAFYIIDGDLPDQHQLNDPSEIKRFWRTMRGKICDIWNNGYFFHNIEKDKSGFYNNVRGIDWDNLIIKKISIDWLAHKKLPKVVRDFIRKTINIIYDQFNEMDNEMRMKKKHSV